MTVDAAAIRRLRLDIDGPLTGRPGAIAWGLPGPGRSFAGYRDYQPGDDFRLIDWNVMARHGRPAIKMFHHDRAAAYVLAIDASRSMHVPDARKWTSAVEALSLVARLALLNGDSVAAAAVGDCLEWRVAAGHGDRHARAIAAGLGALTPDARRTDLRLALDHAASQMPGPGTIVLASDWLAPERDRLLWIARIGRLRHRVCALVLSAPLEIELPDVGLVRVADAETGRPQWLDTGTLAVRQMYAREAARRRRSLLHQLRRAGAVTIEIRCDRPLLAQLHPIVRRREGR